MSLSSGSKKFEATNGYSRRESWRGERIEQLLEMPERHLAVPLFLLPVVSDSF